jgi:formylglycine-generating enzyme required for sulfatase activity
VPSDVGSKPLGDGRYLQSDLVGSAWEWVLDGNNGFTPCTDCIFFGSPPTIGVMVGGAFDSPPDQLELAYMTNRETVFTSRSFGFRCARAP